MNASVDGQLTTQGPPPSVPQLYLLRSFCCVVIGPSLPLSLPMCSTLGEKLLYSFHLDQALPLKGRPLLLALPCQGPPSPNRKLQGLFRIESCQAGNEQSPQPVPRYQYPHSHPALRTLGGDGSVFPGCQGHTPTLLWPCPPLAGALGPPTQSVFRQRPLGSE